MIHNYKLYVFGSRATNRARKYSDIDLAIDSQELTPQRKILRTLQKIRSNPNRPICLLGSQIPNTTHNKKANNIKSLAFLWGGR